MSTNSQEYRLAPVVRTCQRCGVQFDSFRLSKAKFCSTWCARGGERNWAYIDGRSHNPSQRQKLEWERFPEKQRARQVVRQMVRRGRITRQPCEVCGNPKTHAHHDDYSKPLEVRWLCHVHHRAIHESLRPPVDLTQFQIRTSRSAHRCSVCGENIPIGERYYDANQHFKKRAHIQCAAIKKVKEGK